MNDMGPLVSSSLGIILVMGGLLFVAYRGGQLWRARRPADQILTHLSTLALTQQCSIAVVRTAYEELILGLTAQCVTVLTRTALTPTAAHSERPQRTSHCKRERRRITAKTRRILPQCQYAVLLKPPR